MLLLVAFGFMNLLAMVALAALILAEKYWSAGEQARVAGIVLIGLAVMALVAPGLVHGVGHQPMSDMT